MSTGALTPSLAQPQPPPAAATESRQPPPSSWRRGPPPLTSQLPMPRPPNMPRERANTPNRATGDATRAAATNATNATGPPAAAPVNAWGQGGRRSGRQSPAGAPQGTQRGGTPNAPGPAAAAPPNAWGQGGKRSRRQSPAGGPQGAQRAAAVAAAQSRSPALGASSTLEGDVHTPVNGYNAGAVKEMMKKAYADTVAAAGDDKAIHYKLPVDSAGQPKNTAPWGARPHMMANGRDFWVEFIKQVKSVEQEHHGEAKGKKASPAAGGTTDDAGQQPRKTK